MKELFDIIPNSTGDGFRMQLSTGVIDVPDDNGGYIISSGLRPGAFRPQTDASEASPPPHAARS